MRRARFTVRLLHFNAGWRWWAFEALTGDDEAVGLNPGGYGSEGEAWEAVARVEAAL